MGGSNGQGSKRKSKGAPAVEAATDPTSASPAGAPGELATLASRQRARETLFVALLAGVSDTEAKALATAAKVINDYERAALRDEEDGLDRAAASELGQIKRQRARMRSGVVREDEAPKLPLAGSPRTH